MSLIHNELAKLSATYVNGLAIAVFAVGGLAPIFTNLYATNPTAASAWIIAGISGVCFAASLSLHLIARKFLKEMKE
jgi:hypothetical protein